MALSISELPRAWLTAKTANNDPLSVTMSRVRVCTSGQLSSHGTICLPIESLIHLILSRCLRRQGQPAEEKIFVPTGANLRQLDHRNGHHVTEHGCSTSQKKGGNVVHRTELFTKTGSSQLEFPVL